MAGSSIACRRNVDLVWLGSGIRDEFGDRAGGDRWIDDHNQRPTDEAGDWRYVANEIEIELFVVAALTASNCPCPQLLSLFQRSTLIHQPTSTVARLVTFSDEAIRGVPIQRRLTSAHLRPVNRAATIRCHPRSASKRNEGAPGNETDRQVINARLCSGRAHFSIRLCVLWPRGVCCH